MPEADHAQPEWPTLLVANPKSRLGRDMHRMLARQLGRQLNLSSSVVAESPQALSESISDALRQGIRRVIVAGGDGTVSLAANLLAGTGLPLGVIPAGTGNTFWWGLGYERHIDDWVEGLSRGRLQTFDLGEAHAGGDRRLFLNSLTIGVSEHLVELLTPGAKRHFGLLAWPLRLAQALGDTPAIGVQLICPDGEDRFETRQLVVANSRTVAGPIRSARDSSPADGLLDVFRIGGPSLASMLRVTVRLLRGHLLHDHEARFRHVEAVRIETDPPVPVDIDGEVWQRTPVDIGVLRGALHVLLPLRNTARPHRHWPGTARHGVHVLRSPAQQHQN